jgi:hypothetical protein
MNKQVLSFLSLALLSVASYSQITLVGLDSDGTTGTFNAVKWDALSGTVMETVPTPETGVVIGSSVHDSYSGVYYFRGLTDLVRVGFDPGTYDEAGSVELATCGEIDMANGLIFAVQPVTLFDSSGGIISSEINLLQYTIADSSEIPLGAITDCVGILSDASAFDSNLGIFHFLGLDSASVLCLYSATTRSPLFSFTKVPLVTGGVMLTELEYDNETDLLYTLSFSDSIIPNLQIQLIDPLTGILTPEADFPGLNSYVMGTSCYDQETGSYVFLGGDSTGAFFTCIYNTLSNVLSVGILPSPNLGEFQCDNTSYAEMKYGLTNTQVPFISSFSIYPNPARDVLMIDLPAAPTSTYTLDILNVAGECIQTLSARSGPSLLDISLLPAGVYWIRIQESWTATQGAKLVVY